MRMGGTIGWILAAWPFTFVFVDWSLVPALGEVGIVDWLGAALGNGLKGEAAQAATRWTYVAAGIASLVLSLFSFALPKTPAKQASGGGEERLAWFEAVKLLRHPFVLLLWLVTCIDAFVHQCYFFWTAKFLGASAADGGVGIASNWVMPVMSVGQIAEITTMAFLGAVLKRLGWRWTLVIGVLGHALRFAIYAYCPQPWQGIVAVQVLHGICYAFFFATVYIFVDAYFPKDVRSSAQGLFNVMVLGAGPFLAFSLCPRIEASFTHSEAIDFHGLFLVPTFCSLAGAILLALFFRPPALPGAGGSAARAAH